MSHLLLNLLYLLTTFVFFSRYLCQLLGSLKPCTVRQTGLLDPTVLITVSWTTFPSRNVEF